MKKLSNYFIMLAVFTLPMACSEVFVAEPSDNPVFIFEEFWKTFDEAYAVFDERNVDWDEQYDIYRPLVMPDMTNDELFQLLTEMVEPLDDGHVSLTAPGREIYFANQIRREKIDDGLFNTSVIRSQYLEPDYKEGIDDGEGVPFIYGKIKDENIGYIFFDYVGDNFFVLNDFLSDYSEVDGYVIDLRHNDGGDFTYCYSEIGRLVDEERFVFRSKTKNGIHEDDFTEWHRWSVLPEGDYIDKPIVVLTDRYTISAGERAVMAFDVLPNVTTIGDTTNGAHGTLIGRELANGWFYSLVTQKVEFADGQSYEGIGLAPDIWVKNQLADIENGVDHVLERAVAELR